jgi:hypothetical protein
MPVKIKKPASFFRVFYSRLKDVTSFKKRVFFKAAQCEKIAIFRAKLIGYFFTFVALKIKTLIRGNDFF